MTGCSIAPVTEALIGCQFRPEGFAAALGQFNPPDYFGAITLDEILQSVFDL